MFLNPHAKSLNPELQDIENFFLVFQEGRVFRIDAQFRNPGAETIEAFVEKHRHLLNMPEMSLWDVVDGNLTNPGRYRICDGLEVRYILARTEAAKPSTISVTDTTVEGKSRHPPALQPRAKKD
jgi:hypothetical protein